MLHHQWVALKEVPNRRTQVAHTPEQQANTPWHGSTTQSGAIHPFPLAPVHCVKGVGALRNAFVHVLQAS